MSGGVKPSMAMLSVYAGQRCIGFLLNRGPLGFEAFDADQRSFGTFSTHHEAAVAISGEVPR